MIGGGSAIKFASSQSNRTLGAFEDIGRPSGACFELAFAEVTLCKGLGIRGVRMSLLRLRLRLPTSPPVQRLRGQYLSLPVRFFRRSNSSRTSREKCSVTRPPFTNSVSRPIQRSWTLRSGRERSSGRAISLGDTQILYVGRFGGSNTPLYCIMRFPYWKEGGARRS